MILQQCSKKCLRPFAYVEPDSGLSLLCDTIKGRLMPQQHEDIADAIYQQDRVPSYFHNTVTTYIDHLPYSYIRGQRPIEWPPQLPPLTHMQFFFCVTVKEGGVQELKIDITETCANASHDILQKSQNSAHKFHTTTITLSIIYVSAWFDIFSWFELFQCTVTMLWVIQY